MKRLTIIFGTVILAVNILLGFVLPQYQLYNISLNSGIIVVTTILLYLIRVMHLKEAFYISLFFFFGFLGLVELILGSLSDKKFYDNWYLMSIIALIVFEFLVLVVLQYTSKKN